MIYWRTTLLALPGRMNSVGFAPGSGLTFCHSARLALRPCLLTSGFWFCGPCGGMSEVIVRGRVSICDSPGPSTFLALRHVVSQPSPAIFAERHRSSREVARLESAGPPVWSRDDARAAVVGGRHVAGEAEVVAGASRAGNHDHHGSDRVPGQGGLPNGTADARGHDIHDNFVLAERHQGHGAVNRNLPGEVDRVHQQVERGRRHILSAARHLSRRRERNAAVFSWFARCRVSLHVV